MAGCVTTSPVSLTGFGLRNSQIMIAQLSQGIKRGGGNGGAYNMLHGDTSRCVRSVSYTNRLLPLTVNVFLNVSAPDAPKCFLPPTENVPFSLLATGTPRSYALSLHVLLHNALSHPGLACDRGHAPMGKASRWVFPSPHLYPVGSFRSAINHDPLGTQTGRVPILTTCLSSQRILARDSCLKHIEMVSLHLGSRNHKSCAHGLSDFRLC